MPEPGRAAELADVLSTGAPPDSDIAGLIVGVFGVTGVAVTTLGDVFGSETVSASDDDAGRLSEVEIDLGEGPLWTAHRQGRPVLCGRLDDEAHDEAHDAWPLTAAAFDEHGIRAVFAFPLHVAGIDVGALGLYSAARRVLTEGEVGDARTVSALVARRLLRRAVLAAEQADGGAGPLGDYARREVYQATGMVLAQMGVSADDALIVLRGHAFASDRSVRDVAGDVLARTLDFSPTPG